MLERLSRTRRNWALVILAGLVLLFAWSVRDVLNPLLLAYLLAFMAHPAVLNLERRGWSRLGAVNVIYAAFFVLSLVLGWGLWTQGTQLVTKMGAGKEQGAPLGLIENLDDRFETLVERYSDKSWLSWLFDDSEGEPLGRDEGQPPPVDPEVGSPAFDGAVTPEGAPEEAAEDAAEGPPGKPAEDSKPSAADQPSATGDGVAAAAGGRGAPGSKRGEESYFFYVLQRIWAELESESGDKSGAGQAALRGAGTLMGALRHWFGSLIGFATLLFLLPIYAWYLLFELERIHGFVRRYVPERERERVTRIGSEIGEVIANFFRGRLLVCLLKGLLLSAGLWMAGLPYALFLGLLAGFLSLIPFVGAVFGFVFAFLVMLLEVEVDSIVPYFLKTAAVFGIVEMFEGYVLVPKILGDSLGLHPLVVFVAVFVGGSAMGMFGFLAALPLTAALVILCRELVLPALADFADEPDPDEEPGPEELELGGKGSPS